MNPILEHHEIKADLEHRVGLLAQAHRLVFGAPTLVTDRLAAAALAADLAEPGDGLKAAQTILSALVTELERRGTDFWATPLGRACAWWTGAGQLEPTEGQDVEVSTPTARVSVLLGITRQGAHKLVSTGTLRKNSITGVRPEDVRREMQSRWPLGS